MAVDISVALYGIQTLLPQFSCTLWTTFGMVAGIFFP